MKFPRFTARLYEELLKDALKQSFVKLHPRVQWSNPVMFLVWLGALFTFAVGVASLLGLSEEPAGLAFAVSGWLWFTVLFANFAEALAEGRAHAQAASLKNLRQSTPARIVNASDKFGPDMPHQVVDSMTLLGNDLVLVLPGDVIPCDGEVVAGVASVDESAVTGESAPVIREAGGDFANVTSGTTVLSDWLVVRPSIASGGGFVERMIRMVEGAERKPTPNETSLSVLLIALTIVYLLLTASLLPVSLFTVSRSGVGSPLSFTFLTGLFISFIPSTIGGLLSPIGIAGMTRLLAANVLARSGRAVEAAGDVDILLLDKTGTITFGNINLEDGRQLRKGSPEAIKARVARLSGYFPYSLQGQVDAIASRGSTPLVIAVDEKVLGLIELKDVVKPDIAARFAKLRRMGVQTVMITGDNRLTAAAIASEAGVDDFIAESTPESKLAAIRAFQKAGHLVAMTGDGANDAPALAQADVALAMHGGTNAAKEAANMVDLDSNPTKLMEVIRTGKEMMITRGALTTFSLMNDLAKYVVVVPAVLSTTDPVLASWNVLGLASPESALLSTVIFNALVIPLLMPFALKGVEPRAVGASELLTRNLLVWGVSGIAAPFVGIALIDQLLRLTGWF